MYLPDDGEEQENLLYQKSIDYLEMYFDELRGDDAGTREWSELEYEVADLITDLKNKVKEKE